MTKNKKFFLIVLVQYLLVLIAVDFFLSQLALKGVAGATGEAVILAILFFVLPLVTALTIFGENPQQVLAINFSPRRVLSALVVLTVLIGLAVIFMLKFNGEKYLTASSWVTGSLSLFLFLELTVLPIKVFSQEFFFRGFLLKKLKVVAGTFGAILLQALLFVILEIFLSRESLGGSNLVWIYFVVIFLINLIFGILADRLRSFFYSGLVYWMYLFFIDSLVFYQLFNKK